MIWKKREWDESPVPFIYVDNFLDRLREEWENE